MTMATIARPPSTLSWFLNPALMRMALIDSVRRMTPRYQWRNPVMFVVYIGSILTTILWFQSIVSAGEAPPGFILATTLWLWATLLFANFAEAIAEGRSKAQAASLKSARKDTIARKLARPERDAAVTATPSSELRKGDIVLVEQGDLGQVDDQRRRGGVERLEVLAEAADGVDVELAAERDQGEVAAGLGRDVQAHAGMLPAPLPGRAGRRR